MQWEPSNNAEVSTEICSQYGVLDHCYTATKQKSLPCTNTLAVSQASSEHSDMHITNSAEEPCPVCQNNEIELQQLSVETQKLKDTILALKSKNLALLSKCALFICNDKQVRLNTGLPNKAALNSLFNLLKVRAHRMRYWMGPKRMLTAGYKRNYIRTPTKSGPKRNLSCKDEFILTLMKLRLGLTNEFLSNLFGISAGTCSSIVNTWITFLACQLKCLVFWPDRNQIRGFMPKSLRQKYPSLRCTIDCSETFIERPRDLKLQACTWSDYKKHNTLKYLVAITPDGMISFISNAWGGRATDRYIVQKSGFLDLIEPYDLILADRGFTIREDLLFRNATLEIPPPSAGLQQMSRSNVIKTKKIANARIHVERAINRIKWFKILSSVLSVSLIPLFDKILIICAALCNLADPLVK